MANERYIFLLFILMLLLNFNANCQTDTGFTLNGEIQGLEEGSIIYLILDSDTVAATHLNKGKFVFKGYVAGGANYYFVRLDSFVLGDNRNFSKALWLTNKKMSLAADIANWPDVQLTGSEAHDEYIFVQKREKTLKTDKEKINFFTEFVVNHPSSLYAPELLLRVMSYITYDSLSSIYTNFSPASQNSFYGKKVGMYLKLNEPKTRNSAAIIPSFQYKTKDNKIESIQDVIKRYDYTLIDFWASWCMPCLHQVPEMKRVFREFKPMGFNIVGISIDKNESDWLKAIDRNALPWENGIDNVMNANKSIFSMYAIPGYILVNKKGEIIYSEFSSLLNKEVNTGRLSRFLYETIDSLL